MHAWLQRFQRETVVACVRVLVATGTLVLLLHAMAKLTQLQRLRFALEKPEIPYPDGSEELTEAMMDSLSKMISLKYIYIANVPWVSLTEIRCVIRCARNPVLPVLVLGCSEPPCRGRIELCMQLSISWS